MAKDDPNPILPLLNTLAIIGTLGMLVYSRMLYKRPLITESKEKERLVSTQASPLPNAVPILIPFAPITVNITSSPEKPQPADGTSHQIKGKLHYVTLGFSLEIRDQNQQGIIDEVKPFILDKLIFILGKKRYQELNTVQGRYILQSQLLEIINQKIIAVSRDPIKQDLVSHLYFTQFIVQ